MIVDIEKVCDFVFPQRSGEIPEDWDQLHGTDIAWFQLDEKYCIDVDFSDDILTIRYYEGHWDNALEDYRADSIPECVAFIKHIVRKHKEKCVDRTRQLKILKLIEEAQTQHSLDYKQEQERHKEKMKQINERLNNGVTELRYECGQIGHVYSDMCYCDYCGQFEGELVKYGQNLDN